ncbi:hypothetical protein HPP92_006533 [Vanilla planifolia]|uniref:Uncharacterized protein n=1 Tax=Vanilla planifolia TaxID=51239 RepID=A0A835VDN9_VANPL|nr:hypothetical protein HPP92_006533 [Vanilla planifolia]
MRERDLAKEEAVRLRNVIRQQRKELRSTMVEVERAESEWKQMVDEKANARYKQVMLEAYDQKYDEATKIFVEYQKQLHQYVSQARDIRRLITDNAADSIGEIHSHSEKEVVYTMVKGSKSSDDVMVYGSPRSGTDLSLQGTYNQLLERQFVATKDALSKVAEAKSISQKLVKLLHGNGEVPTSTLHSGVQSQSLCNTRQFQLDVWAKERDVAGLKASINTLTSEVILERYLRFKVNEDFKRKLEDVSGYGRFLRLSPRGEETPCKTLLQRMVFEVTKTKLKECP